MREHQIVITLKPEQFLQVQKLAKNAGAKSMGMFVRQKLLMALGIEAAAAQPASNAADIEPLVGELKRLHTELREFVNESLAMYSEGLINGSLGTPVTDQASVLVADPSPKITAPQPASMDVKAPEPHQDSLKAQQTPLSPRQQQEAHSQTPQDSTRPTPLQQDLPPQSPNAPVPSQKSFPQAFIDAKPAPPVMPIEDPENNYYEPENPALEETSLENAEEQPVEKLYEDEPIAHELDKYGSEGQAEYENEQHLDHETVQPNGANMDSEETFNDVSYAELAAEIAESGNTPLEEPYANEIPAPAATDASDADPSMLNDDMESTANKTFAISPRLGPIEHGVPDSQTALPQTPSFRTVERKKPTLPISTPPAVPSDEIRNDDNDPAAIRSSLARGVGQKPSVPMRQQPKRDPLAELLSDEDFEKQQKPAPRVTPNNDPEQTEDESDETFDIPLSLMQRRRTLEEMNKDVPADNPPTDRNINEQQSTSGQTTNKQTNLNSNSADNDQTTSTAHPHHSRIQAAETNLSSPEEKPQSTAAQGSTPAPPSWTPLENPDEDTPLSGGPPPKKRQ